MDNKEYAIELHNKGYNCAQAVALTFAKKVNADETMIFKAMEGFGLGMGGMQCTCGALSGAILVAGLVNSDGKLDMPQSKKDTYKLTKAMTKLFLEKTGALSCETIKGVASGNVLCQCSDCIKNGVEVVEEILNIK